MTPEMSIIIPTSGPAYVGRLQNCLASIVSSMWEGLPPFEVILTYMYKVDTRPEFSWYTGLRSSRGKLINMYLLPHEYKAVDWVPSLARNVGFRRAHGQVLVSVDADSYLHPDLLMACVQVVKSGGFARARTKMLKRPSDDSIFKNVAPDNMRQAFEDVKDEGHFGQGPGCVIAASAQHVRAIRGWDERFVGYGAADHDFVLRLRQLGVDEIVFPNTSNACYVIHQYHKPIRKDVAQKLRKKNRRYFEDTKKRGKPTRNDKFWGGWPRE